jgi:anti-sigma-K factor RskA
MNQILSADEHHQAQLLLPWYVTGRLDLAERALVEEHLKECAECRGDLASERALAAAIAAQPAETSPAWEALAARIDAPRHDPAPPRRRTRDAFAGVRRAASGPQTLRWVVAAQFAALLVLGASVVTPSQPAPYRVLGDETAPRSGNVLAMFRPQTTEARFRHALQASGARLVDGPTAANAYVLEVPGGEGGAALSRLRHDPEVRMAEPIDQDGAE